MSYKTLIYSTLNIVLFSLVYVRLLDYSILLKARHDELIHALVVDLKVNGNHEIVIQKWSRKTFLPHWDINLRSLGTQSQYVTNELHWPLMCCKNSNINADISMHNTCFWKQAMISLLGMIFPHTRSLNLLWHICHGRFSFGVEYLVLFALSYFPCSFGTSDLRK